MIVMGVIRMKKLIMVLLTALLIVSLSSIASAYDSKQSLRFGKIRYGSVYDSNLELHYNARNDGSKNIDNAKVILWVPELDFYIRTSTFDLEKREKHGQFLFLPQDEVKKGTYLAKMTLSSDYAKDSKWIWLVVE